VIDHYSCLEDDSGNTQPKDPAKMAEQDKFAVLRRASRIWAVAPVHGEAERLRAVHDYLAGQFQLGDRLVYLGGFLGRGPAVAGVVDELLRFRREILALPNMFNFDLAYLRGAQEEMWQKLLQLQFAPNPKEVLPWMLQQGVGATITAYGGDPAEGIIRCREGALAITRWTNSLRGAMQARPGHYQLMSIVRRAAYTDDLGLLFVHAGLDPERPLDAQGDSLWWGSSGFSSLNHPYGEFLKVVRGFDRQHGGPAQGPFTMTLDGGCGFGGKAIAACLDPRGEILDLVEA
jgi:serine/threonine protein phosphatase 1